MALKGVITEKRGCCSLEWKIKEIFSESPHVDECWYSPPFHFSNALWRMNLYPNGQTCKRSTGLISIYLNRQESETEKHEISCILGLKTSDGTDIESRKYTHVFESNRDYGWHKFYELQELLNAKEKLFPGGAVILFCQIRLIGGENGVDEESQTGSRGNFSRLTQNFKDMFLNEVGADVTFKVKNKEFRAHSQILSARSSVFAAMFSHGMKEKNTGIVEIHEYDPDAIKEFLIFLYSGQTEKLSSDNVIDLYSAADKYDMEDLKTRCCEFIQENMSVDSFCIFLSLAITYGEKELIDFSTSFFLENVEKIIATDEWVSFAKEYPLESNELVMKSSNKFIPD